MICDIMLFNLVGEAGPRRWIIDFKNKYERHVEKMIEDFLYT